MTQWFRRAAALRTKCLNLVLELDENPGSGSASERTSQSRQLMSAHGTSRHFAALHQFGRYERKSGHSASASPRPEGSSAHRPPPFHNPSLH